MAFKRVTLSLSEESVAALDSVVEKTGIPGALIVRALVLSYAAGVISSGVPLPKLPPHGPSLKIIERARIMGQAAL